MFRVTLFILIGLFLFQPVFADDSAGSYSNYALGDYIPDTAEMDFTLPLEAGITFAPVFRPPEPMNFDALKDGFYVPSIDYLSQPLTNSNYTPPSSFSIAPTTLAPSGTVTSDITGNIAPLSPDGLDEIERQRKNLEAIDKQKELLDEQAQEYLDKF